MSILDLNRYCYRHYSPNNYKYKSILSFPASGAYCTITLQARPKAVYQLTILVNAESAAGDLACAAEFITIINGKVIIDDYFAIFELTANWITQVRVCGIVSDDEFGAPCPASVFAHDTAETYRVASSGEHNQDTTIVEQHRPG